MNKLMKALARVSLVLALVLSICSIGMNAHAADYSVAMSTTNPTTSAGEYTNGAYPNISGNLYLRQFTITNFGGTTQQNVSVYDTCTSSSAASLRFVIPVAASATYTSVEFPASTFQLASPCFSKSDTGSTARITITYQ